MCQNINVGKTAVWKKCCQTLWCCLTFLQHRVRKTDDWHSKECWVSPADSEVIWCGKYLAWPERCLDQVWVLLNFSQGADDNCITSSKLYDLYIWFLQLSRIFGHRVQLNQWLPIQNPDELAGHKCEGSKCPKRVITWLLCLQTQQMVIIFMSSQESFQHYRQQQVRKTILRWGTPPWQRQTSICHTVQTPANVTVHR